MNRSDSPPPDLRRVAIAVRGIIQGVGFRPFVYNRALALGLTGWVRNEADTVRIEAQGRSVSVDALIESIRTAHPPQARIDSIEVEPIALEAGPAERFEIRVSLDQGTPRPTIPSDLATCAACREEITTSSERRFGYPFTNCTNCGPRWSIIEALPYDRPRTSMAGFTMCVNCRREYEDPTDRRFHAQPIACPDCGPTLELLDSTGHCLAVGPEALPRSVEAVLGGKILALKGLGGFQLVVDATQTGAVIRLRQRKHRPERPFALMLESLDDVRACCHVSEAEAELLTSPQSPIVLLRRRDDGQTDGIAKNVAPGNPYLGVMLPYTPLHHLLLTAIARPIVCTSGNLSEEPMAIATDDALKRLGTIADLLLVHDRPIVRPLDDSIARVDVEGVQVLRRARGFAPLPINLDLDGPTVLAVGGHLKNAVALKLGPQVIVSPHVGDLDSVPSVEVHRRAIDDLVDFFQATPELIACDPHPDYASTRHAESLAARWGVPLIRVQHHHAHVAACMAEHQLDTRVLGFAWDGTGYGPDGTVWGGEVLECEGAEFRRLGHLRTFPLPGGDRAAREPRRSALGLLYEILGHDAAELLADRFDSKELDPLLAMLDRSVNCPRTSSLGRLFDAVAALCGLPDVISFEGQSAMALEFVADLTEQGAYPLPITGESVPCGDAGPMVGDWEPMVRAVLADRKAGTPTGKISARFHHALAEWAVATAQRWGRTAVALSGGCFQNRLLADRVRSRLTESGFKVHTHRQVPPGDGGIALGQTWIATQRAKGS